MGWWQGVGEAKPRQAGFRKGRGTRDQIANIHWIVEKATEFQKNIYFCFIDYANAFDCVDHNKLWKILNLGGTRRVGGLLGVAGRLSGTVSPFRAEQGTSLRRRGVQEPHLAKRWEPRGFSRTPVFFPGEFHRGA